MGTKNEAYAYNNIGFEYLINERYDEAIAAFEKAINLNPKYYPAATKKLEQPNRALNEKVEMKKSHYFLFGFKAPKGTV